MTREEEAKVIRAVLDGNTNAFDDLVLEYQDRVYHITLKMTGNEEDAFDLSQETFLKAFRSLKSFRGEASFGTWLYRLASNLCIDFLRKKKRRGASSLVSLDEEETDGRPRELPDLRYEPQNELERKETREKLRAGLRKLPEEQRLILVLRDVEGLSYQQIGDVLQLELGTVKSRIYRARARLAALLTEEGNFFRDPSSEEMKRR
ncbi:MAG: sigma-70 family RNA polymerase sigma factor [Oscillospiraceae bacterium]|nr:sigma-70 family RNA polymerase sigma factor [Oscillospiraceae bacterium]